MAKEILAGKRPNLENTGGKRPSGENTGGEKNLVGKIPARKGPVTVHTGIYVKADS